ncbi:MAG: MBL fold metallo-hydrolase [Alphaproteobacteria bacterium]|nr:MBL fold metallo-hydrolase [Alphaproteobacteria bacterium]
MVGRTRNPASAPGDWFIDTACIDCGAAPNEAPGLIVRHGGACIFARQPATPAEEESAFRAMQVCPTASVQTQSKRRSPRLFPRQWAPDIFQLGFNARSSYGANSWFAVRADGNLMVDAPRWSSHVIDHIAASGGLARILLTHRDDVADAERYAEHFGARVFVHEGDAAAAPFATDLIRGGEPAPIAAGVTVIPTPGHTIGSVVFLLDETFLFTGDSLDWNHISDDLRASPNTCWFSWTAQTDSLERLAEHRFEWVLAGHGGSAQRPPEEMRARLLALVGWMRRQ